MAQTILVIEDDVWMIELVRAVLEPQGYRVLDAQEDKSGIDIAITQAPDLILLESRSHKTKQHLHVKTRLIVHQSEWDGFDVCFTLRANPQTQSTPIIMMLPKIMGDNLPACADAYLIKPWAPVEMVALVKKLLGHSASYQPDDSSPRQG